MYELSIGSTCDDIECHLKVILAYVVIPASNISEIIYDTVSSASSPFNRQTFIRGRDDKILRRSFFRVTYLF